MAPLGAWARGLRAAAGDATARPTIVAGNEASDADSIVSALVYAYLLAHSGIGGCVIPVVACGRADISLRGETVLLLSLCGVDASHLVFLDDPEVEGLLARCERLVLTDHNQATGSLAALDAKVSEIVDHHKDLGAHGHVIGEQRKIAFEGEKATAGSACSLITEAFLAAANGPELLASDGGAAARALLGVVLIDTVNLDPKAQKATPRDIAAVEALERASPEPARGELFAKLDAAKFDEAFWSSLEVEQCLRYDFKQFDTAGRSLGLSSVLCSLEALASKAGWADAVEKWAGRYALYGVLSMTKSPGGGAPQRQLLLISADGGALAAAAAEFATAYDQPALQLEPLELQGPAGMKAFRQLNSGASRKQVAPCLGAFLASAAKCSAK